MAAQSRLGPVWTKSGQTGLDLSFGLVPRDPKTHGFDWPHHFYYGEETKETINDK